MPRISGREVGWVSIPLTPVLCEVSLRDSIQREPDFLLKFCVRNHIFSVGLRQVLFLSNG